MTLTPLPGRSLRTAQPELRRPPCPGPRDLGVHLVGRYGGCAPGGPIFSWSGSGFSARFAGELLEVTLSGPPAAFTVVVDGDVLQKLITPAGTHTHRLVPRQPASEHTVMLLRQSEASFGPVELVSVNTRTGAPPVPYSPFFRRMEVVGDSISAGYGNEGTSPDCAFSLETENHYLTYGALLARTFEAELSTIAWSGKGVVSNYNGNLEWPMPTLYDRAVGDDPTSVWTYEKWVADVVLVNLGTNDYSTNHDPAADHFVDEYASLLATIRARYPKAAILSTIGPLLQTSDLEVAEANIQQAVQRRRHAGDTSVWFEALRVPNSDPGCDWHPGLATHAAMARALTPVVEKLFTAHDVP